MIRLELVIRRPTFRRRSRVKRHANSQADRRMDQQAHLGRQQAGAGVAQNGPLRREIEAAGGLKLVFDSAARRSAPHAGPATARLEPSLFDAIRIRASSYSNPCLRSASSCALRCPVSQSSSAAICRSHLRSPRQPSGSRQDVRLHRLGLERDTARAQLSRLEAPCQLDHRQTASLKAALIGFDVSGVPQNCPSFPGPPPTSLLPSAATAATGDRSISRFRVAIGMAHSGKGA